MMLKKWATKARVAVLVLVVACVILVASLRVIVHIGTSALIPVPYCVFRLSQPFHFGVAFSTFLDNKTAESKCVGAHVRGPVMGI